MQYSIPNQVPLFGFHPSSCAHPHLQLRVCSSCPGCEMGQTDSRRGVGWGWWHKEQQLLLLHAPQLWGQLELCRGHTTCRAALESLLAAGDFSSSFAWITLVLCLPFSAGRAVWIHITYMAKCALIGQELVLKCQEKIYFPVQPLQVLIFLWAAR